MIVIEGFQYLLAGVFGFLLAYQALLSFFALFGKKNKRISSMRHRKFAIVIPAYNEEHVITKTIYSLSGIIYPKSLYDLIVVADNCTDNTAKIAEKLGSRVLERTNNMDRGKGFALRWAFNRLLDGDISYEAIVVIDSDSLVSGNFLEVMNYYLENGSHVVQSSDLVLPKPGSWSSESTRIGFLLYNYVKPLGRKVLGLPMGLRGNGMCFSADILRRFPWNAWSQTEDVEYGLNLLINRIDIDFAPEATVWAIMPAKAKNAESQRERWELGRYSTIKKYAPRLFNLFRERRSLKYFDALVELISPPLVNTFLLIIIIAGINGALAMKSIVPNSIMVMWLLVASLGFIHLFLGLIAARADASVYKSIFYIPLYAVWKMKVYISSLYKGTNREWIRTTRER